MILQKKLICMKSDTLSSIAFMRYVLHWGEKGNLPGKKWYISVFSKAALKIFLGIKTLSNAHTCKKLY